MVREICDSSMLGYFRLKFEKGDVEGKCWYESVANLHMPDVLSVAERNYFVNKL